MFSKLKLFAAVTVLALTFAALPAFAEHPDMRAERPELQVEPSSEEPAVSLTDQQKSELAAIHRELFDKKKQLIAKYVEFGIISQDKASKWTDRLDAHYEKLEQNGFVPTFHKCKKEKKTERD